MVAGRCMRWLLFRTAAPPRPNVAFTWNKDGHGQGKICLPATAEEKALVNGLGPLDRRRTNPAPSGCTWNTTSLFAEDRQRPTRLDART